MAITAGILLVAYLIGIGFAILTPPRSHDPQRGMAVGCLGIVAVGTACIGAVLAVGVIFDIRWCVMAAFYVAVFPAILLVPALLAQLIKVMRKG